MGGVGMAQRSNRKPFVNPAFQQGGSECRLDRACIHAGPSASAAFSIKDGAWKQQSGMSMSLPETTQRLECQFGQNDVAILASFAVTNMHPMLACIDIINLELESFGGSQAQAIDNKQEDAEA
jgi:hypothetical protein